MSEYNRDSRSPVPASETVSRYMRSNKAKNTKPELLLRKALWADGIRGYRLHWKKAPGKPDIAFPARKLAVFVNGCFWHRCPKCDLKLPKNNHEFWQKKFERNIERDGEKLAALKAAGWRAIVIWECDLKRGVETGVKVIQAEL